MNARFVRTALVLALALGAALPAFAQRGATPIWQPTTITVPGHYVVTRNITALPGGVILDIMAPNVYVDLNGMQLFQPDPTLPAILGSGPAEFRIRNGSIVGGNHAVENVGAGAWVTLEEVRTASQSAESILLRDVSSAVIRNCNLQSAGAAAIRLEGGIFLKEGVIEHNEILRTLDGIQVFSGEGLTIQHNRMQGLTGGGAGTGIYLETSSSILVSQNVMKGVFIGIGLRGSSGCKLYNNVIGDAIGEGISLDSASNDNLLRTNVVTAAMLAGIGVNGSRNYLQDNTANSNTAWGILFSAVSAGNVYKENVARGNSGGGGCPVVSTPDFCDSGFGNTTAGDNFLPFAGM